MNNPHHVQDLCTIPYIINTYCSILKKLITTRCDYEKAWSVVLLVFQNF
jgi:hypothetical protein